MIIAENNLTQSIMYPFIIRELDKGNIFQSSFGILLNSNALIELNNLLANSKNIRDVTPLSVACLNKKYNLQISVSFKRELEELYKSYIRYCFYDNRFTNDEADDIFHLKKLFEISDSTHNRLYEEVGEGICLMSLREVLRCCNLTDEMMKSLKNMKKELELSDKALGNICRTEAISLLNDGAGEIISDKYLFSSVDVMNIFQDDSCNNIVKLFLKYPEESFWYFSCRYNWLSSFNCNLNPDSEDSVIELKTVSKMIKHLILNNANLPIDTVSIISSGKIEIDDLIRLANGTNNTKHQAEIINVAVQQMGIEEAVILLNTIPARIFNVAIINNLSPERVLFLIKNTDLSIGLTEDETDFLFGTDYEKKDIVLKTKTKTVHTYYGQSSKRDEKIIILKLTFVDKHLSGWEDNRDKGNSNLCQLRENKEVVNLISKNPQFIPNLIFANYLLKNYSGDTLLIRNSDLISIVRQFYAEWPIDELKEYDFCLNMDNITLQYTKDALFEELSYYMDFLFKGLKCPVPEINYAEGFMRMLLNI